MFMNEKRVKRDKISLVFSIAILIGEIIGQILAAQALGWKLFCYYTQDSNLLLLIATVIWLTCVVRRLRDGVAIPRWVRVLKYTASCTVALTFVVVLAVLAPMQVDTLSNLLFSNSMLWCHTVCPLLAIISTLFFDTTPDLDTADTVIALIPTVIYGLVAILLNILKVWHGPYPFLYVYEQPVWASALWVTLIVGGAWLLSFLLYLSNRAATREYVYR